MSEIILALIGGLLSGVALGLTGGGGSIIAVPLLVYLVGEDIHLAIITSLIAVGVISLIASFSYIKESLVKFKIAFLMATPGIISIYLGSLANKVLKGPELLISFAILMIFIGFKMTKPKNQKINKKTTGIDYKKILILGFVTGFASGFFGVGGGFLLVPALYMGANLKIKEAIATSLFIIFLFGVFGLLSYVIQGREIDYSISAIFAVGGALGGFIGAYFAKKINQDRLRFIFAIFTIIMGIGIFIENIIKLINL
ncbi:sulfite exporter TauE/SafE family protein [Caminibacter profundus]